MSLRSHDVYEKVKMGVLFLDPVPVFLYSSWQGLYDSKLLDFYQDTSDGIPLQNSEAFSLTFPTYHHNPKRPFLTYSLLSEEIY